MKVTSEDLQKISSWDTSFVWDNFPQTTDVLTIHGLSDATVPPYVFDCGNQINRSLWIYIDSYDALIYARALSDRAPGTHSLHFVENADHIFTGQQDDIVGSVLHWLNVRQAGMLKTGIWISETKGKL